MRLALTLLGVMLIVCNPSFSSAATAPDEEPLTLGALEYAAGEYSKAAVSLRKTAEQGGIRDQLLLGYLYAKGTGVKQDIDEAAKWFRMAAEQGDPIGQYMLGATYVIKNDAVEAEKWFLLSAQLGNVDAQEKLFAIYAYGLGVAENMPEASKWAKLGAENGCLKCQVFLAYSYSVGDGVIQDYEEAAKWGIKAAESGDAGAQYIMGNLSAAGMGVPKSNVKAHMWFNLSAASGYQLSEKMRDDLTFRMTKKELAEAQKLAREWTPKTTK